MKKKKKKKEEGAYDQKIKSHLLAYKKSRTRYLLLSPSNSSSR